MYLFCVSQRGFLLVKIFNATNTVYERKKLTTAISPEVFLVAIIKYLHEIILPNLNMANEHVVYKSYF